VIKQAFLNLVGGVLPAATAIVCTPMILNSHGSTFFGEWALLTALLMIVGLMDLGIARGITLVTYDKEMNPSGDPVRPFKAGLRLSLLVAAIVLTLGAIAVAGYFVWRNGSTDLLISTGVCLCSGAITILTLPFRSLMEIKSRFGWLNTIRSLMACAVYIAPLLVAPSESLILTLSSLLVLVTRVVGLVAYSLTCGVSVAQLRAQTAPDRHWTARFMNRCGWVGLTNALSMVLMYADRFILAAVTSATQVAHYAVASEAALKIWLVTGAVQSAVTPQVAAEVTQSKGEQVVSKVSAIRKAKWLLFLVVVMPSAALIVFCEPLLRLWLGQSFDSGIVPVARVLVAGVALNSMSQLNFSLLQLHGGESAGAMLQIGNIVVSAILMLALIPPFGTVGAAGAFTIRLMNDAFVVRQHAWTRSRSKHGFTHPELAASCIGFLLLLGMGL
jgi:O-antigen/teichoic acid export membrane protein